MKTFTEILSHRITNMKQVHKTMRALRREIKKVFGDDLVLPVNLNAYVRVGAVLDQLEKIMK